MITFEELLLDSPIPVRFEIVPQRFFNVYGFEKDSTMGILWSSGHRAQVQAQRRMAELEKYFGLNISKEN